MSDLENYPVTLEEAAIDLGFDEVDDMVAARLNRLIKMADGYIMGAVGDDYPRQDPRAKELALILINDFYDNRNYTEPRITSKVRALLITLETQLLCEMRRLQDGA